MDTSAQDIKFLNYLTGTSSTNVIEIENNYADFNKHEKIRVEQWCKKLCEATSNSIWKKSRNLYAMLLLDQVLNGKLEKPFNRLPPEASLPSIKESEVVSSFVKEEIETLSTIPGYMCTIR